MIQLTHNSWHPFRSLSMIFHRLTQGFSPFDTRIFTVGTMIFTVDTRR